MIFLKLFETLIIEVLFDNIDQEVVKTPVLEVRRDLIWAHTLQDLIILLNHLLEQICLIEVIFSVKRLKFLVLRLCNKNRRRFIDLYLSVINILSVKVLI